MSFKTNHILVDHTSVAFSTSYLFYAITTGENLFESNDIWLSASKDNAGFTVLSIDVSMKLIVPDGTIQTLLIELSILQ